MTERRTGLALPGGRVRLQSSSPVQQRWRTNARVATAAVSEICLAVSRLCACAPRNATASNKPTTSSKLANRSWRCRSCLAADDCTEVAMVSSAHGLSDDRSSPILCRSVGMNVLCGRASARSTGSLAAFRSLRRSFKTGRARGNTLTRRRREAENSLSALPEDRTAGMRQGLGRREGDGRRR